MIRCSRCFGQKTVMMIGLMEEKCPLCNGVGQIEHIPLNCVAAHLPVGIIDKPCEVENVKKVEESDPKKRGRPANHKREE